MKQLFKMFGVIALAFGIPVGAGAANLDATLGPVTAAQVVTPQAAGSAGLLDNFNRADGPLGANWVEQSAGTMGIVTNAVTGNAGTALSTFVGGSGSVVQADISHPGTAAVTYVGVVLDFLDINNNVFVKVQDNASSGFFDTFGCYYGNNGSNNAAWAGQTFAALTTPFSTAHLKVAKVAGDVVITLSKIDGTAATQTYTCTAAPAPAGTGIGINTLSGGVTTIDNFAGANLPVPTYSGGCALNSASGFDPLLPLLALLALGVLYRRRSSI